MIKISSASTAEPVKGIRGIVTPVMGSPTHAIVILSMTGPMLPGINDLNSSTVDVVLAIKKNDLLVNAIGLVIARLTSSDASTTEPTLLVAEILISAVPLFSETCHDMS